MPVILRKRTSTSSQAVGENTNHLSMPSPSHYDPPDSEFENSMISNDRSPVRQSYSFRDEAQNMAASSIMAEQNMMMRSPMVNQFEWAHSLTNLRNVGDSALPDAGLLQGYLNYFQNASFGTHEDYRRHMHAFRKGITQQLELRFPLELIYDWLDQNCNSLRALQDSMSGIGRRFQLTGTRLAGVAEGIVKDALVTEHSWPIADQVMVDQMVKAMVDPGGVFDLVGTKPHQHWQKLPVERFTNIAHRLLVALKRTHAGYDFTEPVDGYALQQRFDSVIDVLKGCKGTIIRLDRPTTLEEVIAHPRKMKQRFIDNQINNLKKKTGIRGGPGDRIRNSERLAQLQAQAVQARQMVGELSQAHNAYYQVPHYFGEDDEDEDVESLVSKAPSGSRTRAFTHASNRAFLRSKMKAQATRSQISSSPTRNDHLESSASTHQGEPIAIGRYQMSPQPGINNIQAQMSQFRFDQHGYKEPVVDEDDGPKNSDEYQMAADDYGPPKPEIGRGDQFMVSDIYQGSSFTPVLEMYQQEAVEENTGNNEFTDFVDWSGTVQGESHEVMGEGTNGGQ